MSCQLTVACTRPGCDEKVSFAEQEILNTFVTALYDEESKEKVLSKDPQMNLTDTILFIEAREAGGKVRSGLIWGWYSKQPSSQNRPVS